MIINKLTQQEFESIIKSIVKLENTDTIFDNISKLFHLPNYKKLFGKKDSDNTGIKTLYKGFEIKVKNFTWVNSDKSEYPRIIVEFTKRKNFIDDLINPMHKIVKDIITICNSEIHKAQLRSFSVYGIGAPDSKLEFLYQDGTYNPNWEKQHKISPLTIAKTIIKEKGKDFYIVEFDLTAECYERNLDKTTLKKDWHEIFTYYSAPMWI